MKLVLFRFIASVIVCSFILCPCSNVHAALVIEPALIKMELSQNRSSGFFTIRNTSDKEERYRAKAVHFILTPDGGLKETSPDEYTLSQWVKFNPKEFVVPPKSSRMVRFSVIPEGKIRQREYWGAIEFMPLKGAKVTTSDDKGNSMNLEILSVILVPIYGFVKGTIYSGSLKELQFQNDKNKPHILCTFLNTGEGILRQGGNIEILNSAGTVVEDIPLKSVVVFTKCERRVRALLKNKLPGGRYKARLKTASIDPHSTVAISGETDFSI